MTNNIRSGLTSLREQRNTRINELVGSLSATNPELVIKILSYTIKGNSSSGYLDLLNNPGKLLTPEEMESSELQSLINTVKEEFSDSLDKEKNRVLSDVLLKRNLRVKDAQKKYNTEKNKLNGTKSKLSENNTQTTELENVIDGTGKEVLVDEQPLLNIEEDILIDGTFLGTDLLLSGNINISGDSQSLVPLSLGTLEERQKMGIDIPEDISEMIKSIPDNAIFKPIEFTEEEAREYLPEFLNILKKDNTSDNLRDFIDYIESIKRRPEFVNWIHSIKFNDLKILKNISEKSIKEKINHFKTTLLTCHELIVLSFPNLFSKNVAIDLNAADNLNKGSSFNSKEDIDTSLQKLVSSLRIAKKTQEIYVKRMKEKIVPYYSLEIDKMLSSFSELEIKLLDGGKELKDFFDSKTIQKMYKGLSFILSVKGYMGGKGLITDKQEASIIKTFDDIHSPIQFNIDQDSEFAGLMFDKCNKGGSNVVEKISIEISNRLYDKPTTKIGHSVAQHVNFNYINIDKVISNTLRVSNSNFLDDGDKFIKKVLEEPSLLEQFNDTCPEMVSIIKQYII